jgi:hypothetical protein
VPLYRFRITEDVPALNWLKGDVVVYQPSNPAEPYTLHRAIAIDPGALLNQFVEGVAEPMDPIQPVFRVVRLPSHPSAPRVLPLRAIR